MFSPNRLEFHYNQVIRPDLLLKINYENIMEVPRLCKIIVVPKAPSSFIKNVKLAMEIVCGQKFIQTRSKSSAGKSFRFNKFVLNQESKKETGDVTHLARSTLRGHIMYNFLEKTCYNNIFLRLSSQNTEKLHSIINGNVVVTIISRNTGSF